MKNLIKILIMSMVVAVSSMSLQAWNFDIIGRLGQLPSVLESFMGYIQEGVAQDAQDLGNYAIKAGLISGAFGLTKLAANAFYNSPDKMYYGKQIWNFAYNHPSMLFALGLLGVSEMGDGEGQARENSRWKSLIKLLSGLGVTWFMSSMLSGANGEKVVAKVVDVATNAVT